ncbi:hypothetical protein LOK49_LG03G02024 [Camellia lanceoleosa]|uniref:Uncharacterized protein n=1 Tax=Camellia lanceoleosa TaxID=1840588 RepID=A0ACC0IF67_9ERIC|nr:hypothetical protein LOK49_LG03G02024 [Camellia lanceoleosa]
MQSLNLNSQARLCGKEMNSHDLQTMCFKFLKDLPLDHIRAQPNTLITMSCDVNQEEADHEQKEGESKKYTKYVIEKLKTLESNDGKNKLTTHCQGL